MFELFASRLSRCVVALALFFAAVAAFSSPASARSHRHHSAERHAYVHHAARYASRHHHYRNYARSSRFERNAAQLQASGFGNVLVRQPGWRCKPQTQARHRNLRSDMRANIIPFGTGVEPCRAINPVSIEQRHRRHLQLDCPFD